MARLSSGIGFVLVRAKPVLRGDRGDEFVRIVGRNRSHGQDVAVVGIDDDGGSATDRTQRLLNDILDARVDREIHIRALLGLDDLGLAADDRAFGVALEDLHTGRRP